MPSPELASGFQPFSVATSEEIGKGPWSFTREGRVLAAILRGLNSSKF